MSGGHWNYEDTQLHYKLAVSDIPKIITALQECLHEVDYAVCGDNIRTESERKIFDTLLKLGDEIFPH